MQTWRACYDAIMADTEADATTKGARLRALGEAVRADPAGDRALVELIAVSLLAMESDRLAAEQASPTKRAARPH